MAICKWSAFGLSVVAVTAAAVMVSEAGAAREQQGPAPAPGQPVPSTGQPRPANSQPRPANSQPPPANQPGTVQPTPIPNQPTTPPGSVNPNGTGNPATVTLPNGTVVVPVPATGTGLGRYERPFAFASPGIESRFVESSHRLVALEARMNQSNQMLLKRLGEVRAMPPDKQNGALTEIVQQMLLDQQQMNKYLVAARTAWSGEIEGVPADTVPDTTVIATPGTTAAPAEAPQNTPR